nr:HU family DNA-binding protein [Oscillospiraceae bacterium]
GEKVSITGFGTFEVRDRPAKQCINPATKKPMTTKPCKALAFKAGKTLKDKLNTPAKKSKKK